MGSLNTFDFNVYSDEQFSFNEEEYASVMADAARVIEQAANKPQQTTATGAWKGSKQVSGILIKKACEHPRCGHYRCERGLRIEGIEI